MNEGDHKGGRARGHRGRQGGGQRGRGRGGRGRGGRGRHGRGGGTGARGRGDGGKTPTSKIDPNTLSKAMDDTALNENWLLEESRLFVTWDNAKYSRGTPENLPSSRIRLENPPVFSSPQLPFVLPPHEGDQFVRHKPGAVEVCRASVAKFPGQSLDGVDIVASSAFLYALWGGHPGALKDRYLLQWSKSGSTLFAHIRPWSHRTDVSVPSFVAEGVCCQGRTHDEWNFSLAKFTVGKFVLLIVSEVDGFDAETNCPVEMKVQAKPNQPKMKELLQISLNGSTQYAQFKLSKNKTTLESLKVVQKDSLLEKEKSSWASAGRRIQCMLDLVLNDPVVRAAVDAPAHMTFHEKLPAFSPGESKDSLFKSTQ